VRDVDDAALQIVQARPVGSMMSMTGEPSGMTLGR
jgi:hypothetical protein